MLMLTNLEENGKRKKRRNSELKEKLKPKQKSSQSNHQRRHSSPPDLRNVRSVTSNSSERGGDNLKNVRKEDDLHVPLSIDENDNFVLVDEEREKTSYDGLNATSTQTPQLGTSEESTTSSSVEETCRAFKVRTKLETWKMQATDLFVDRLRDFVNDEPEATDPEYIEGDPLAVKTLKENINRFSTGIKPITGFVKSVRGVFSWSNPAASFLIFVVYTYSVLHGYLLSLVLFVAIWKLFMNYLHVRGITKQLGFTEKAKDDVSATEDYSWSDKFQLVLQVARKVQNTLGKMADSLEKMKNLLTWQHPEATGKLFVALCMALLASLILKGPTLFMLLGLFLGIKFFIVNPIYHRFPKVKRRYDSTAKLWRELPTDANIATKQNAAETNQEKLSRASSASSLSSVSTNSSSEQIPGIATNHFSEKFKLPSTETSLPGWEDGKRCTLIDKEKSFSNVKQGRLFLSQSYLCFEKIRSSSAKNIVIKLDTITNISKVKLSGIMPGTGTALEVQVRGMDKPYVFGGIIGRDEVLESITLNI